MFGLQSLKDKIYLFGGELSPSDLGYINNMFQIIIFVKAIKVQDNFLMSYIVLILWIKNNNGKKLNWITSQSQEVGFLWELKMINCIFLVV